MDYPLFRKNAFIAKGCFGKGVVIESVSLYSLVTLKGYSLTHASYETVIAPSTTIDILSSYLERRHVILEYLRPRRVLETPFVKYTLV